MTFVDVRRRRFVGRTRITTGTSYVGCVGLAVHERTSTAYVAGTTALVAVQEIKNACLWDYDDDGGCTACSIM